MEDTICAVATSLGVGAIAIIRLSGPQAVKIVDSIFSGDLLNAESHTIHYGHIVYNQEIIDEVLVMLMLSPKTYTTEDTVEINCHGGYNTVNKILEILLNVGCRLAEPGEFTKRAYLNERINLLESEAVNELIKANTDAQRKMSINQIGGLLTKKINDIRELLVSLMANIEVNIDYPEYKDNLEITENILKEKLYEITIYLSKLVKESEYGKIVSDGITVAIVGKPNVGKSSILNHLLDENKAIVTSVAGTTRDLVEGTISLNGIEVRLIDTAGIHDTVDKVEKIGVKKSLKLMKEADVILLVLDGSHPLDEKDEKVLLQAKKGKTIIFVNKNDKKCKIKLDSKLDFIKGNTATADGLDGLKSKLVDHFNINLINKDMSYLSNARQISLIKKANSFIKTANKSLKEGLPVDIIERDLKSCYEQLGQILGDSYEDVVIDHLFKNFCVGK